LVVVVVGDGDDSDGWGRFVAATDLTNTKKHTCRQAEEGKGKGRSKNNGKMVEDSGFLDFALFFFPACCLGWMGKRGK
jgi:hypothetical protein